jgi:Zn-dependent protease with chaperone function
VATFAGRITVGLILKIAAGIVLAAVIIAALNAWSRDREERAFSAACLSKDQAAALYALGRTSDSDIYRCMHLRNDAGMR